MLIYLILNVFDEIIIVIKMKQNVGYNIISNMWTNDNFNNLFIKIYLLINQKNKIIYNFNQNKYILWKKMKKILYI